MWVCSNCGGIFFNPDNRCTRCGLYQGPTAEKYREAARQEKPAVLDREFDPKPWLITLEEIRALPEAMER